MHHFSFCVNSFLLFIIYYLINFQSKKKFFSRFFQFFFRDFPKKSVRSFPFFFKNINSGFATKSLKMDEIFTKEPLANREKSEEAFFFNFLISISIFTSNLSESFIEKKKTEFISIFLNP